LLKGVFSTVFLVKLERQRPDPDPPILHPLMAART
jgi:hypothetical protein